MLVHGNPCPDQSATRDDGKADAVPCPLTGACTNTSILCTTLKVCRWSAKMEKRNTRVTVPLSGEEYDAVTVMAKAAGQSRGAFLAEILGQALPGFVRIAKVYERAIEADQDHRQGLAEGMAAAELLLRGALDAMDNLDGIEAPGAGERDAGNAGARSPARGSRPPYNNMGVPNRPDRSN